MIDYMPPAFLLLFGGLLTPLFKGRARSAFVLLLPVASFVNLMGLPQGANFAFSFMGLDMVLGQVDKLSLLFGVIFHIILVLTVIYSLHVKDALEHTMMLLYAGAAIGVTFAGDLFSLFLFWETLTVTATVIIWCRRTKSAARAGFRYMIVHVVGGLTLLCGIVLHYHATGSTEFSYEALKDFAQLDSVASVLIFLGFGVNCAWPALHNWLVDAYPEGTPAGTVALSAFTTKSAVYVLARAFPGATPLIWIGAAMTAFPIFFAVIENDLRRVLSYSVINQVGFMVCGIGIGTQLALNGAVSHAFNDILFKALLFMSVGAVMYRTGKTRCTDLGGLYKSMPITCVCCLIGAASISAFPLFSGFVSKSMVVDAAAQGHMQVLWIMFLFASAGVLEHAGIKIPFFTFFSHDSGIRCKEAPWNMLVAMVITAALCVFIGVYPYLLYAHLPWPVEFEPYTTAHVVTQLQLLVFAGLAFTLLMLAGVYPPEMRALNIDTDWWYRKGWKPVFWTVDKVFNGVNALSDRLLVRGLAPKVVSVVGSAPPRLALAVLAPFWVLTGQTGDKFKAKKEKLYTAIRTSTTPIGVSAAMAALMVFGLIVTTLLLRK